MFFHRPHDRPGEHDRRRGGILAVLLLCRFARLPDRIPARIDLQVRRNDAAETARDRGRECGFDLHPHFVRRVACSRPQMKRIRLVPLGCWSEELQPRSRFDPRGSFFAFEPRSCRVPRRYRPCRRLLFSIRPWCRQKRLDRINRFVGFDFAQSGSSSSTVSPGSLRAIRLWRCEFLRP